MQAVTSKTISVPKKQNHTKNLGKNIILSSLRALGQLSPKASAKLAYHFMFRTKRFKRSEQEQIFWQQADEQQIFMYRNKPVHIRSWGKGPSVLLVHGWQGRGSQYYQIARALLSSGFRVVAFDAPGHGDSQGNNADLVQFKDVIFEVAERQGNLHAVVGHSLGALASIYALGNGLKAERAVLISAVSRLSTILEIMRQLFSLNDKAKNHMNQLILERFPQYTGRFPDVFDGVEIVKRLKKQALIIHDRSDRDVPLKRSIELAETWEKSIFHVSDGLGHNRILRDHRIAAKIAVFLKEKA